MQNETMITSHHGLYEVTVGDTDLSVISNRHGERIEYCTVWVESNTFRIVRIVLTYSNGEMRDSVGPTTRRYIKQVVDKVIPRFVLIGQNEDMEVFSTRDGGLVVKTKRYVYGFRGYMRLNNRGVPVSVRGTSTEHLELRGLAAYAEKAFPRTK